MKYKEINYDETLEQFLISCILGDGSFTKVSGLAKNSKLSIAHCIKQKEYIEYKHSLLSKYDLVNGLFYNKSYNHRYKEGFIEEYRFKSKSHPLFTSVRNSYYDSNGKKRINKDFIKKINPFGLALWFMDDGSFDKRNKCITLSTCAFDEDTQQRLVNKLNV